MEEYGGRVKQTKMKKDCERENKNSWRSNEHIH